MFNQFVSQVPVAGFSQLLDLDIEVTSILFANDLMTIGYNITFGGSAKFRLRSGQTDVPIPENLALGLEKTFQAMLPIMLAKLNPEPPPAPVAENPPVEPEPEPEPEPSPQT